MKRTRKLVLSGLMAAGGLSLNACGGREISGKGQSDGAAETRAYTYSSLRECLDKDEAPNVACERAASNALSDDRNAATWPDRASCEAIYGQGQCTPPSTYSGHSAFWGPLLMGFVMGRTSAGAWGGRALYRDWRGGGYYTAGGGRLWTNYPTGRMRISTRSFDPPDFRRGPEQVLSCRSIRSRGGFGAGMGRQVCGDGRGGLGG